ncbi:MAG: hypothetical protein ABIW81_06665 [Terrimesophilobacter sp.]
MATQRRHARHPKRRWQSARREIGAQTGSVTAEFAAVMPAVVLVLGCCLGGMQLATVQARLQDSASTVARSAARGDSTPSASLGRGEATILSRHGNLLCASVTRDGSVLFGIFGVVNLTATSCTLVETP